MKKHVSPDDLVAILEKEEFQQVGKKMTICLLTLKNGHEIIGQSGCVDPAMYDLEIGSRIARDDAMDTLWGLMGYALQVKLHEEEVEAQLENCDE